MILLKHSTDLNDYIKRSAKDGSVGFVPTMGALHAGHISLIEKSKQTCDITVNSIFINPTQFNNPEDLKKYPVKIENDIYLLETNGCDVLFLPDVNEIYPDGTEKTEHVDLGYLETILEGKFRPGHFQGVCQVVKRLLEIVQPTHLFLGQKDYQQCMVIKRLLQLIKLDIQVIICPTLREANGLAMSSRNLRLDEQQKDRAAEIYKTLDNLKQKIQPGKLNTLKNEALINLEKNGCKPDYIEIANSESLNIMEEWDGVCDLVILTAAFVDDIRLIDNVLLARL